jgi:two-component system phosphate regulon sensor histidine kinase PhoR
MLRKVFKTDPLQVFYYVFGYILLFAVWWGYLLYDKNETAYHEKIEINIMRYALQHPGIDYTATEEYKKIEDKYQRQRIMIFTEGTVFLVLLLAGLWIVRKSFKREMELAEQQKNFLLSITHEFKSPLASVKLSLQTMAKHQLPDDKKERMIGNSLQDIDRLDALVENILFAAKIERDQPGFSDEEVNVSELVKQICVRLSQNKKQITIIKHIQDEVYMLVDSMGFTSVVVNLIENAIKYSAEQSVVYVELSSEDEEVQLKVSDEGLGISDEEKLKVFDKFYRVGNEDTRKTKGTGLGLYIVKRFVAIYDGHIELVDNHPRGSVFTITLPMVT